MIDRIGGAVGRELGRFGPSTGIADVVKAWPGAVGEGIARNAWPARIARDGTLHVHASSSTWAFELGQLAPTLVERLRKAIGEAAPAKLRFAVGAVPEPSIDPAEAARRAPVEPGPQHVAAAEELVAGIADEELRKVVAKAAAASLARADSDRSVW